MFRNIIYAVVLAILFTWFALSNSQIVTVSLFLRSYQFSLSLVILICILIGIIISGVAAAIEEAKMLRRIKELEAKVKMDELMIATQGEKKE